MCSQGMGLPAYSHLHLAFLLIICFSSVFSIAYPHFSSSHSDARPIGFRGDGSTSNALLPRGPFDPELQLGRQGYNVQIQPLNLVSPVISSAGFARVFYSQVMASAWAHIQQGTGRWADLRYTYGEVYLSFKGLFTRVVDWEMIYEFAKWMRDRAELGMVGLYRGAIWSLDEEQYVRIVFGIMGMNEHDTVGD